MKLTELLPTKYKIYCDMDGVLTDFDKRFMDFSKGVHPDEFDKTHSISQFWAVVGYGGEKYWTEMQWIPHGKQLWDYIKGKNPSILSAPSKDPKSKTGKIKWVDSHLQPKPELLLVNAKEKQQYATEASILIDDKPENIQRWKDAGGVGILCKGGNSLAVIGKLKELGI